MFLRCHLPSLAVSVNSLIISRYYGYPAHWRWSPGSWLFNGKRNGNPRILPSYPECFDKCLQPEVQSGPGRILRRGNCCLCIKWFAGTKIDQTEQRRPGCQIWTDFFRWIKTGNQRAGHHLYSFIARAPNRRWNPQPHRPSVCFPQSWWGSEGYKQPGRYETGK